MRISVLCESASHVTCALDRLTLSGYAYEHYSFTWVCPMTMPPTHVGSTVLELPQAGRIQTNIVMVLGHNLFFGHAIDSHVHAYCHTHIIRDIAGNTMIYISTTKQVVLECSTHIA